MATWLTHLRVADRVYDELNIQDMSFYFAGSIAPDTDTNPDISHWCTNGDKTTCDVDRFFRRYIKDMLDKKEIDFYIGYYVHLLTDMLWHEQKVKPIKNLSKTYIASVKQGWREVDLEFIKENRNFRPVCAFLQRTQLVNHWFDYYTAEQVENLVAQVLRISFAEQAYVVNEAVREEIEQFINESTDLILKKLRECGL